MENDEVSKKREDIRNECIRREEKVGGERKGEERIEIKGGKT